MSTLFGIGRRYYRPFRNSWSNIVNRKFRFMNKLQFGKSSRRFLLRTSGFPQHLFKYYK